MPGFDESHKLVATWISLKDFELLEQLARTNNVKLAAYVRAIIVDAIQEEIYTIQNDSIQLDLQLK